MTLMVRNEADIIDSQIAFHLAAGVDFVIAMDHGSTDETTEILERYERSGVLHLLRVSSPTKQKSARYTRMARMAATEFGADWVINSDADEFWWPSGGSLKDVLRQMPAHYGIVRTFVRPFLPRPEAEPLFERMTVRFAPSAPINNPFDPFRANVRLVHRGDPSIVVGGGNASVRSGLSPLRGWSPIEVLHLPIRSLAQFERKFLTHYETSVGERQRGEHVRAYEAKQAGTLEQLYSQFCVDDAKLARGLAAGTLAVDNRLREAIRQLDGTALFFPRRSDGERAEYAVDEDVLTSGETVRLHRRADDLQIRLRALEQRR
jgi:hypothetical protein